MWTGRVKLEEGGRTWTGEPANCRLVIAMSKAQASKNNNLSAWKYFCHQYDMLSLFVVPLQTSEIRNAIDLTNDDGDQSDNDDDDDDDEPNEQRLENALTSRPLPASTSSLHPQLLKKNLINHNSF